MNRIGHGSVGRRPFSFICLLKHTANAGCNAVMRNHQITLSFTEQRKVPLSGGRNSKSKLVFQTLFTGFETFLCRREYFLYPFVKRGFVQQVVDSGGGFCCASELL